MGREGASLSCPGSSVVAENGQDNSELNPQIKSPDETRPRELSNHQQKMKICDDSTHHGSW